MSDADENDKKTKTAIHVETLTTIQSQPPKQSAFETETVVRPFILDKPKESPSPNTVTKSILSPLKSGMTAILPNVLRNDGATNSGNLEYQTAGSYHIGQEEAEPSPLSAVLWRRRYIIGMALGIFTLLLSAMVKHFESAGPSSTTGTEIGAMTSVPTIGPNGIPQQTTQEFFSTLRAALQENRR